MRFREPPRLAIDTSTLPEPYVRMAIREDDRLLVDYSTGAVTGWMNTHEKAYSDLPWYEVKP